MQTHETRTLLMDNKDLAPIIVDFALRYGFSAADLAIKIAGVAYHMGRAAALVGNGGAIASLDEFPSTSPVVE